MFGAESKGGFCTFQSMGPNWKYLKGQGLVLQYWRNHHWSSRALFAVSESRQRDLILTVPAATTTGEIVTVRTSTTAETGSGGADADAVGARSRRREWARPREIERPWASDDEGDDGWSWRRGSSGLETKKSESELKLEEVHSDLAKRVSEVAASWACAGASDWSDLMNSLGKFHIEDQSPERLGGARCERRCGEEDEWLTGLFRFDPV